MTITPRHKLYAAAALLLALPLVASLQGASATNVARVLLAMLALAGLGAWFVRARGGLPSKFRSAPRLNVVQRVGLSPRTGIALIEVDGRPFLVVHGDGFARIRPAPRPARVRAVPKSVEPLEAPSLPS